MAEEKGLNKMVKLKADLAAFLGTSRQTNYKPKQSMVNQKMLANILWLMRN